MVRAVEFDAAAAPLLDQLVVIAADGMVARCSMPRARRLWEALEAGCSVDDLADASMRESDLGEKVARANIARTLTSWRALGLINSGLMGIKADRRPRHTWPGLRGGRRSWMRSTRLETTRCGGGVTIACSPSVIDTACRSCRVGPVEGLFPPLI